VSRAETINARIPPAFIAIPEESYFLSRRKPAISTRAPPYNGATFPFTLTSITAMICKKYGNEIPASGSFSSPFEICTSLGHSENEKLLQPLLNYIEVPLLDPIAFRLGGVEVRWYSLAYLLGFVIAYSLLRKMIMQGTLRPVQGGLIAVMLWLFCAIVAGGRLGWWLFYHRTTANQEPWYEIFAVWHGGMSFHSGAILTLIALVILSICRQISFWNFSDGIALVVPFGLFLGRIANFINAELIGRPTNLPWGVIFPGYRTPRHPSQIYEALLEGPILLLLLLMFRRFWRLQDGQTAALFLIIYGVFRFFVEFTRAPDQQLGFVAFRWLTMGQLLSIMLISLGAVMFLIISTKVKHITSSTSRNL
jgi:phosphatidylglycerol:prolipoprotein diacylglycerol transferase